MKFLFFIVFVCLGCFSFNPLEATPLRNYVYEPMSTKYSLEISYSPSISAFIASSNERVCFDKYSNTIFFRGSILETDYSSLRVLLTDQNQQKNLDNLYADSSRRLKIYREGSWDITPILLPALMSPILVESFSLYCFYDGHGKKEIVTSANRIKIGSKEGLYSNITDNQMNHFIQPLILVNGVLLLANANPWVSFITNGLTLIYSWHQKSASEIFAEKAFPCSIFDKALYESSFNSKTLWTEFKLANYYNENDQLNDKFFEEYEAKALKIPDKFKPYEAGIYEGIAEYLKAKKDEPKRENK